MLFFLFLIIVCIIPNSVYPNDLPQTVLEKPKKYIMPYNRRDLYYPTNEVQRNQVWVVYSDRENNKTYKTPNGIEEYGSLSFLEQFYVAEEQDEYVRLVRDFNNAGITLSSDPIDFGWIKKDKLLLWSHCLVTIPEKGKINKKAMVLNKIEDIESLTKEGQPNIVKFYKAPSTDSPLSGKDSKLYQIFYIYKQENNMVLLGKEERIDDDNENMRRHIIVGWAPLNRLTPWDHRIALEPNWNPDAVEERRNGKKAKFFIDIANAKKYKEGETIDSKNIFWDSDPLGERHIGEWRRFPYLRTSSTDPDVIIAGIMGEVHLLERQREKSAKTQVSTVSPEPVAELQRKLNASSVKKRSINIVFVIDGTTSMAPYFNPISKSIIESMRRLSLTRNEFQFGATIYRDWAEGRERLRKTIRLTSDYEKIAKTLRNFKAGDINDTDEPEAVFYGLKDALRNVRLPDDETNVIILIGDAGNHHRDDPSQVKMNDIIKLLGDKNCHFLAFQVHHESDPSYDEFITQTRTLIMRNAQNIYSAKAQGMENDFKQYWKDPKWDKSENTYKIENGVTIGWLLALSEGEMLEPYVLKEEINNFISELDKINDNYVRAIQDISEGNSLEETIEKADYEIQPSTSKYVSSFAPGIINLLKQQGISEEELRIITSENYQIYIPAVAPMYVERQNHPLFREVLLLSRVELHKLWDSMNMLAESGSMGIDEQRYRMTEVWKQLLKEHLGEVDNAQMETLSLEEIHEKVFGLPSISNFLKDKTLRDIQDRGAFPDDEFAEYVNRIKEKEREFFRIINEEEKDYKYCFRSNEQLYYWISQDMLP